MMKQIRTGVAANRPWRPIGVTIVSCALFASAPAGADDWPQWRGPGRDGVWRESGIVRQFAKERLEPLWRAAVSGGYSGPTVAGGRVYVMDRRVEPKQMERILCFDAKTGQPLWTQAYVCEYRVDYDAGPRASVTIDGQRAYALGAMGHFHCLDAGTGKVHWAKDLDQQYKIRMPVWGIAASPLIEGELVIVQIGGEGEACLVAFDRTSGEEKWRALKDNASYSAPVIIERGGRRILVCYTGDTVTGLDPKTGRAYWSQPFPARKMVIGISTPVYHDGYLFVTNFFDGSLLLRLSDDGRSAEKVWQRAGESEQKTDALHSIISTPLIHGGHIYGCDSYGELRCLDLKTGDRVWESDKAVKRERWANIHFVVHAPTAASNASALGSPRYQGRASYSLPYQGGAGGGSASASTSPNASEKNVAGSGVNAGAVRVWMFNEQGELIIADLSPSGYKEIDRAKLLEPTRDQLPSRRGGVCWSHPAFAGGCVFVRSDQELLCASLKSR